MPHARLDEKHRAFFKDYCVECHNAEKHKGKLRLDDISFSIESVESADRWQKILNQLNSGEMPPEDAKRSRSAERKTEFLDALSQHARHRAQGHRRPGRTDHDAAAEPARIRNTIRDLLGVEIDVRDLPADGGTGTFDTVGASLFMSGDQIEQYLALGRRALDEQFARARLANGAVQGARRGGGVRQQADGRPLQTHEGAARQLRALDGGRWMRRRSDRRTWRSPRSCGRTRRSRAPRPAFRMRRRCCSISMRRRSAARRRRRSSGSRTRRRRSSRSCNTSNYFDYYADYQKLPGRDTGAWLLFYQAYRETYVDADAKWPAGRYTLRMRVAANDAAPKERRFVEVGQRGDDVSDFTVFGAHQVTGTLAKPQVIEAARRCEHERKARVCHPRDGVRTRGTAEIRSYHDEFEKTGNGPVPAIWIDWLEIEGPLDTRSPPQSLVARTQDSAGAREVIERFATRAFRGRSRSRSISTGSCRFSRRGARRATRSRTRSRSRSASCSPRRAFSISTSRRRTRHIARSTASNSPRVSRISCGARRRMTSCSRSPAAVNCKSPPSSPRRWTA